MFLEILKAIAYEVNQQQIPYMVIGGQAVLLYGVPRLTQGIDITLALCPDQVDKALQIIEHLEWQVLVENPIDFTAKTWVLPVKVPGDNILVDFFSHFSHTNVRQYSVPKNRYSVKWKSNMQLLKM